MEFVANGSGYWSGLDVSCAGCTRHCSGSFAAGAWPGSKGWVGAVEGFCSDGVGDGEASLDDGEGEVVSVVPDGVGDGSLGEGDAVGSVGVAVAVGVGVGVEVVGVGVGVSVVSVAEGVV